MKKYITFILILLLFSFCTQEQEKVERIIEDGVEVVVNHIEPYKIKGEPSTFSFEGGAGMALLHRRGEQSLKPSSL